MSIDGICRYGISVDEAAEAFSKLTKISATCFEVQLDDFGELVDNAPAITKPYGVEVESHERPLIRCQYCGVTTDKRIGLCDYCGAPLNVIIYEA